MIIFINENEEYLKWIKANPRGFIVNSFRKPIPRYLILHSTNCGTITKATRGPGNWTNTGFIKICSLRKSELVKWAKKETGGKLQPCQVCRP
jgi:hypothetical protein